MAYVLKVIIDINNSRRLILVKDLELFLYLGSDENFRSMDIAGFYESTNGELRYEFFRSRSINHICRSRCGFQGPG